MSQAEVYFSEALTWALKTINLNDFPLPTFSQFEHCLNFLPQKKGTSPFRDYLGRKSKISSGRRLGLKIKMLNVAQDMLMAEKEEKKKEREVALSERIPPLKLTGLSVKELQDLCRDLHHKIDVIDEERYDIDVKVSKNEKEIEEMTRKIIELKGKMKRPILKRVKISAEAMLSVLLGSKHKESIDFKANLKTVKKEEEKKEEVTDWRKNVEAMSGMEGRKKLFNASH
ncbi:hypothetical protein Q7C36_013331 [Tachysurus vachellii]|uniref:Troponin I n=2 Tax=Tachysurus vachellii TaxID=175792 RepID=A0AA88SMD4_TACVA|nr:hypothetical protein Q7C36_013331 [Tachysurus vachellii]